MKLIEELFQTLAKKFKNDIPAAKVFLKKTWKKIGFEEFLEKEIGLNFSDDKKEWVKKAKSLGVIIDKIDSKEKIADAIFKKLRGKIIEPTFVIDHPLEISPLAKKKIDDPKKTARFQLIVFGSEVVNGFSELNDPIDQKQRFKEQAEMKKKGDIEAHPQDTDYIEALEYGMPPTAGLGIGIDRLVAVLTRSSSLKEVIFFPFMKPRNK